MRELFCVTPGKSHNHEPEAPPTAHSPKSMCVWCVCVIHLTCAARGHQNSQLCVCARALTHTTRGDSMNAPSSSERVTSMALLGHQYSDRSAGIRGGHAGGLHSGQNKAPRGIDPPRHQRELPLSFFSSLLSRDEEPVRATRTETEPKKYWESLCARSRRSRLGSVSSARERAVFFR